MRLINLDKCIDFPDDALAFPDYEQPFDQRLTWDGRQLSLRFNRSQMGETTVEEIFIGVNFHSTTRVGFFLFRNRR